MISWIFFLFTCLEAMVLSTNIYVPLVKRKILHTLTIQSRVKRYPRHTLFDFEVRKREREKYIPICGWDRRRNTGILVTIVLRSKDCWNQVSVFVCTTTNNKTQDGNGMDEIMNAQCGATFGYYPMNRLKNVDEKMQIRTKKEDTDRVRRNGAERLPASRRSLLEGVWFQNQRCSF